MSILLFSFIFFSYLPFLAVSLSCYSCYYSFVDVYDQDNVNTWCTNGTLKAKDEKEVVKPCALWEKYCVTAVTTMHDAFTSVQRQCGTRCQKNCEGIGYGSNRITCYHCCKDNKCNNEYSLDFYLKVMSNQYTHWTVAVKGESEFNKRNGIKFPY